MYGYAHFGYGRELNGNRLEIMETAFNKSIWNFFSASIRTLIDTNYQLVFATYISVLSIVGDRFDLKRSIK